MLQPLRRWIPPCSTASGLARIAIINLRLIRPRPQLWPNGVRAKLHMHPPAHAVDAGAMGLTLRGCKGGCLPQSILQLDMDTLQTPALPLKTLNPERNTHADRGCFAQPRVGPAARRWPTISCNQHRLCATLSARAGLRARRSASGRAACPNGCGSRPCTAGKHQNRWYMGVHPPQNGGIGYDP